jgi:mannosyltransferase
MRRIADALLLGAMVIAGAVLRFGGLAVPSLWLDEILDYDVATKLSHEPLWRWLTGFDSEHGPLFFATELAGRVAQTPGMAARLAPALFGVAAIVVAWIAGRGVEDRVSGVGVKPAPAPDPRLPTPATAIAPTFALLLAGSPLAIYYSREARPYALLMLLATAMLAVLLWAVPRSRSVAVATDSPGRATTVLIVAIPLLALFATSGATPLLIAAAITAFIAFLLDRRRGLAFFAGAAVIAAAAVPLLYRRMPGASAAAGFRPITTRFFIRLLQSFSVSALDATTVRRAAYVLAALALIGAIALLRRDRVRGTIVVGMAVLPVAVSLLALWRLRHWYAVRYVATALPAYLLLAAIGISAILQLIFRRRSAIAVPFIAIIAAALIVREGWPAARTEPYRKLNWRVIAATIHEHAHARDNVLTTNDWSYVCLDFYLRRLPPRVRLLSAGESSARAASVAAHNTPLWIVSAGFHRPGDIGDWSCQFPVVLASPLESFRLHYAPGIQHLLLNRLTPADTRALVARYPTHVMHLGAENAFFLGGGWYGPEGESGDLSRWTNAEPVSVMLIASASIDHRLLLRMAPFDFRGAPPQVATISLNGAPLAQLTLARDWKDYPFDVPRARWRDGVNFLTVAFSRANVPASVDPNSRDIRPLAGRFNLIAVMPAGSAAKPADSRPELTRAFRVNEPAGELLDENAWWRGTPKPEKLRNRAGLTALLGRLGFDPRAAIPKLDRGEVDIEELSESVAYDSGCLNDSDFLHLAYATLVNRAIDADGERYFASALTKKETRIGVVRALVDSEELKRTLR